MQISPWEYESLRHAFREEELQQHAMTVCGELGLPHEVDMALFEKARGALLTFTPP